MCSKSWHGVWRGVAWRGMAPARQGMIKAQHWYDEAFASHRIPRHKYLVSMAFAQPGRICRRKLDIILMPFLQHSEANPCNGSTYMTKGPVRM